MHPNRDTRAMDRNWQYAFGSAVSSAVMLSAHIAFGHAVMPVMGLHRVRAASRDGQPDVSRVGRTMMATTGASHQRDIVPVEQDLVQLCDALALSSDFTARQDASLGLQAAGG